MYRMRVDDGADVRSRAIHLSVQDNLEVRVSWPRDLAAIEVDFLYVARRDLFET
jgi:hypothetical protein